MYKEDDWECERRVIWNDDDRHCLWLGNHSRVMKEALVWKGANCTMKATERLHRASLIYLSFDLPFLLLKNGSRTRFDTNFQYHSVFLFSFSAAFIHCPLTFVFVVVSISMLYHLDVTVLSSVLIELSRFISFCSCCSCHILTKVFLEWCVFISLSNGGELECNFLLSPNE